MAIILAAEGTRSIGPHWLTIMPDEAKKLHENQYLGSGGRSLF
jgi:hypothetical protein